MSTSDFSDSDLEECDPLDEQFSAAAEHLQKIHDKIISTDLLEIYGLYKQATCGQCNTPKPSVFNMQSRSKWCAWNDLGEMSAVAAKRLYIEKVQKFDPEWQSKQKNNTHAKSSASGWVVHSIPQRIEDTQPKEEHEKNVFDYIKEGNLQQLRKTLTPESMELLDEHGMGLIHWAADRNAVDILQYLIEAGVNVNLCDADKQTALHYAASCGHIECIRIILSANADTTLKDADGQTCLDVAESTEICEMLKI